MSTIIYNVTLQLEKAIGNEWLQWLMTQHAPQIIATNCFTNFITYKLLYHDDEDKITYVVQYFSKNIENYQRYIDQFSESFRKEAFDKWGNKFIAFRTVMEVVD